VVLNLRENRLCLHQGFVIRKTQYPKTLLAEPLCARLVLRTLILMLPAVQLDDQHAFDTAEIDDVRTDRMQAAKLHTQFDAPADASRADARRQSLLGAVAVPYRVRVVARSQLKIRTRKRRRTQASGASSLDPHPNPPPRHGGGSKTPRFPNIGSESDAAAEKTGMGVRRGYSQHRRGKSVTANSNQNLNNYFTPFLRNSRVGILPFNHPAHV
jgi:hypothetical protein